MANRKQIRESLVRQLKSKGADVSHFVSLIDDYCWYWAKERAMRADISKNGYTYSQTSSIGATYERENPCVKTAVLYNKQKLLILKELGLTTDNVMSNEDDRL